MAKSSTSFKKGTSGNPKGRPPRERALTTLLENAGIAPVEYNGNVGEARQTLAQILWSAATSGRITFADGRNDVLSSDDWFDIVKFLYATIDPPRKDLDVTSAGEPITLNIMGVIPDDDSDSNDDPAV